MKSSLLLTLLLITACGGQDEAPAQQAADPQTQAEAEAPAAEAEAPAPQPGDAMAAIHIEGMVCESCADAARSCLEGVDGVHSVSVSVADKRAQVSYDPDAVTPENLLAALQGVDRGEAPPFEVSLLDDGAAANP